MTPRPTPGAPEDRSAPTTEAPPTIDGRKLRGVIPYGVESRDMGGWREVIDPGALKNTDLTELIATREHDRSRLLGRHPTTLTTEDRADGFAWAVELPDSPAGEDVRVAVERGDLRASSWRQVVARDYWTGDVRHIAEISHLLDVTVTAAPAYAAAAAEFRSQPDPAAGQEDAMADTAESTAATAATETATTTTAPEDRSVTTTASGGLTVENRVTVTNTRRSLADEFRHAGWPGETATISFETFEDRAIVWTGSVDNINKSQQTAGGMGADQRYIWPAVQRVNVDSGATSVDVFTQTARTLPSAASTVRAIDAVTAKPEVASTLTIVTTALKQVAAIYTNVPNIQLEQPAFNSVIETDLTLSINEGLDKLVLDFIATAGFQAPSTDPLLVSIRKAMTTIMGNGYNPDTVALTPANAEALDLAVSGITGGTQDFVFTPGAFAPNPFGLTKRISKSVPAAAVFDSRALGKL